MPAFSIAAAVTTLNVDPGGYRPASARLRPPAGRLETARMFPVDGSRAIRAAFTFSPSIAAAAAPCTFGSMVVFTGLPGSALLLVREASASPDCRSAITTSLVAVPPPPRSCLS